MSSNVYSKIKLILFFGIAATSAVTLWTNCSRFEVLQPGLQLASSAFTSNDVAKGRALYATNCASCHGDISVTTRAGRTEAQITASISAIPQMNSLASKLSVQDIRAIAMALNIDPSKATCNLTSAGQTSIRRLTVNELQNALVDLFGVNQNFVANVDVDVPGPSGFNNDGSTLTSGYIKIGKVVSAIEAATAAGLSASNSRLLNCANGAQDATCARTNLQSFARLAYRRPVSSAEVDNIMAVYTANSGDGFSTGMSLAVEKVLVSPNFMFITAFQGGNTPKGKALTSYEFASRLAFFLWNSIPDEELLTAADKNTLGDPTTLRNEIKRMLQDPRSQRMTQSLYGQWFNYDRVLDSNGIIRNGITDQLRTDMFNESNAFVNSIVTEDVSLMRVVTADYSYLNSNLASHYGIGGVSGNNLQKVTVSGAGRTGLLSQGSVMTVFAQVNDSRPVARGKLILDKITCQPPGPPPPNVDLTAVNSGNLGNMTVRQKLDLHAQNVACNSCHASMDAAGLSLENFDQLGGFRSTYSNGQGVDASGTMFQANFANYLGLSAILAKQPEVRTCLTTKVLTYALNRAAGDNETCEASLISALATQDSSKFSDLVYEIVTSDMFMFNATDSN